MRIKIWKKESLYFNPLFQISMNSGGGKRDRTADPLRARQVLSQLSYTPTNKDKWKKLTAE